MNVEYWQRKTVSIIVLGTVIFAVLATSVMAQDKCGGLADKIGHGGLLWTENAIVVQGTAAPDLSDTNRPLHIIKEMAKRGATADAYRKAAGILAGVRLTSKTLAGNNPTVVSKINAFVRKAVICKTKFYADGGVDVVVKLPITGAYAVDQFAAIGTEPATGKSKYTGIIVDASDLIFAPALVPRMLKADGSVVFSAAKVSRDVLLRGQAVYYVKSFMEVKPDIVGSNPLKARAVRLGADSPSDLIIDSNAARVLDSSPGFLSSGKIVIITRGSEKIDCKAIADTVQNSKIDWESRIILARGNGRVNFRRNLDNTVRMRMMEQAAEVDAQRKLLKAALHINIDSRTTLKDLKITGQHIHGAIVNAVRCDTKYFRDGSSEVVLAAPIDGMTALSQALGNQKPISVTGKPRVKATGLIIDASGHKDFIPSLAPRLVGTDGIILYGAKVISRAWVDKHGVAGYSSSIEKARSDERVGDAPLIITPIHVASGNPAGLVVGRSDAELLMECNTKSDLLRQGRVIIVTTF